MVFDRNNISYIFFLELISLAPLAILLGNIVPPFPIKIHFIVFGLVFLIAIWILATQPSKKWLLYLGLAYFLIQFTLPNWDLKSLIDFMFGPFVLLILVDILVNNRIPLSLLKRYERRFYSLLWIPIIIAILQFFGAIPFTFWNATYINYALIDGIDVPRPNGFLYHGSELSIVLCFTALFQFFKPERKSFWVLILLVLVCIATYFKAILACVVFLFFYYLLFINKGALSQFRFISKKRLFWYGGMLTVVLLGFMLRLFYQFHFYTGYYFPHQLLTGRGYIWNIYFLGIKDFSIWNYLFGGGMGSAFEIFKEQVIASGLTPFKKKEEITAVYDTHNAVLSVFVNAGIVGLLFIVYIYKIMYTQIKTWRSDLQWTKRVYFAVFILPILTIGITINYYEMAIFWPCLGFLFFRWYFATHGDEAIF